MVTLILFSYYFIGVSLVLVLFIFCASNSSYDLEKGYLF